MESIKNSDLHSLFQSDRKEVEHLYENWKKALITNDLVFLENLYASDFTSFSSCGILKNKSEVLTRLGFKDVRYLCWQDKSVDIDFEEGNAVLKSIQTLDIELYGLPIKINREIILTFEKNNRNWFLKNIKEITG